MESPQVCPEQGQEEKE